MIYLKGHKYLQEVYIPVGYTKREGAFRLVLHSTIGLDDIVLDVKDERLFGNYYLFSFTFADTPQTGEYEYEVLQDGEVKTSGMARIVGAEPDIDEYNKTIEYEQYNG